MHDEYEEGDDGVACNYLGECCGECDHGGRPFPIVART